MTGFTRRLQILLLLGAGSSAALQERPIPTNTRRSFLLLWRPSAVAAFWATTAVVPFGASAASASESAGSNLQFSTTPSGLQWADAKVGSGPTKSVGDMTAIDYVMSTTGARYGAKVYSTTETNQPYRWKLGDGTTIKGLEVAILGGEGIPPMQPGGIRRVIVPAELAYASLAKPLPGMPMGDCSQSTIGPIPPVSTAFEEFQRFKNLYCNANRPYQPDLVMDIKLYGKRN